MVIFNSYLVCVNVVWPIRYVVKDRVYVVDKMLRPIINAHKNINLTDTPRMGKGMGINGERWCICQVWWLLEENGSYGAWGVVLCRLIFFLIEELDITHLTPLGLAYILKGFQFFFYLVGCFFMGRLWWLFFHGSKVSIFLMFCCRQMLVLVSPRWL